MITDIPARAVSTSSWLPVRVRCQKRHSPWTGRYGSTKAVSVGSAVVSQ